MLSWLPILILLFNVVMFALIIFFSLKIAKLIKEKYGKVAAIIFMLFVLFTGGRSKNSLNNNDSKSKFERATWSGHYCKTLPAGLLRANITLKKNWYSETYLRVVGVNDTLKDSMSLEAYTCFKGWEMVNKHTKSSVYIERIENSNEWHYMVSLYESWYLLGMSFYTSEEKDFEGTIKLRASDL